MLVSKTVSLYFLSLVVFFEKVLQWKTGAVSILAILLHVGFIDFSLSLSFILFLFFSIKFLWNLRE